TVRLKADATVLMILPVRAIRPERTDVAVRILVRAGGCGVMREIRAGAAPGVDRLRQLGFRRLVVAKTADDAADAGVLRKGLVAADVEQHALADALRTGLRQQSNRLVRDRQLAADGAVDIRVLLKHPDRGLQGAR